MLTLINKKKNEDFEPANISLMDSLKDAYTSAWNKNVESRAKGKATGTKFEKWVFDHIGFEKEFGPVSFSFGPFSADVAIPSRENANVVIEIKLLTDKQQALAMKGLLVSCKGFEKRKIGYVLFYKPTKIVENILKETTENYPNRFKYFIIEKDWAGAIKDLNTYVKQ